MTLELDSKPTRTRRAKSLEEQVAEADAIPYLPHIVAQGGVTEEEIPLTYDKPGYDGNEPATVTRDYVARDPGDEPEGAQFFGTISGEIDPGRCECGYDVAIEDWEPGETCPVHGRPPEDPGEIEMTSEQQAEFEARARLGFGGPNGSEPGTILVTGYDANGEAVDVEVERSARAQEAAATGEPDPSRPQTKQIEMPGFEGHKATKVTVSFSGSITLDLGIDRHKAMWDELRWQTHKALTVTAFVNGKGFKAGKDNVAGASLTVMSAHLEDDAYGLPEGDAPCESCGRESDKVTADDVALCQECYDSLLAEHADEVADSETSDVDDNPVATALDEALAIAGDDDDGDA